MIFEYWMMQSHLNKGLLRTFEDIDRWTVFAFYAGPIAFILALFGRGFLRIVTAILIPILFVIILEPGVHK
jgi:hypothetical protein